MWLQNIKNGLLSHVLLKCVGITLFISLFFIAYFHILKNPISTATIIPLTYVDNLIAFQPLALPLYLSLWIYVVIPAIFIGKQNELYAFGFFMALMSIVGLIIFYFWPSAIAVSDIDWSLHPTISFLKNVDAAGNACPSLHVATAIFSGAWTDFIFRRINSPFWPRAVNLIWGMGIIYSTIATRQHVVLDVLGGMLLAGLALILVRSIYWRKFNP